MKPHDEPHGMCSLDPITLTGLVLGGLGATVASSLASPNPAPTAPTAATAPAAPPTPTAAAPPASNPMSSAKPPPAQQQSFIGAAATPNTQSGQKTLLGQ
jgi:hypothetical protein